MMMLKSFIAIDAELDITKTQFTNAGSAEMILQTKTIYEVIRDVIKRLCDAKHKK